jgi:hypothetical protein
MTALKKARAAQLKYIQHQPLKKHVSSATRYIYTNEDWSLKGTGKGFVFKHNLDLVNS